MKIDILILIVTGFLIYNTYHDGKALSYFKANKKYFEISI